MSSQLAPACPACGKDSTHPILRLNVPFARGDRLTARVFACRECTHRFLPITEEEQQRVDAHYDRDYMGYRFDPFFAARIRDEVARQLVPRVPPPARVLDVGCGAGEFMRAAAAAGYQVEGVDISEAAAEHCRGLGLHATSGDFLTMPFAERYSMVTMWDVVEHLRSPEAFLRRAREILVPGGALVLKIPGYGPLSYRAIAIYPRLASTVIGAPGHQQYFTPRSLRTLLARCGYENAEWLGSGRFRSKPATRSIKKLIGRTLTAAVNRVARNGNLYIAAYAAKPADATADASSGRTASAAAE